MCYFCSNLHIFVKNNNLQMLTKKYQIKKDLKNIPYEHIENHLKYLRFTNSKHKWGTNSKPYFCLPLVFSLKKPYFWYTLSYSSNKCLIKSELQICWREDLKNTTSKVSSSIELSLNFLLYRFTHDSLLPSSKSILSMES